MFLFSRWERAVCRVKAIASSVERLLRYANFSGSSEAGSTEQMCSLLKPPPRCAEIRSFSEALLDRRRMAAGDRPNLQAGCYKRSNPAVEAFQWRISASAKSQWGRVFVAEKKKSEMRQQSGRLYSQMPLLFCRATAGYISISLRAAAEPLFLFFCTARTNGRAVKLRD